MRIWTNEDDFDFDGCVAALGMFDGVHIGHQELIFRAMRLAKQENVPCIVYTFDRHPLSVICPEKEPRQLLPLSKKLDKFEKMGVDGVLIKPFTPEFAATEPEEYLRRLSERLHPKALVAGFNFSFGDKGLGNADMLLGMADELGYRAVIVDAVMDGDDVVSSTLLRRLKEQGEMQRLVRLLQLEGER